MRKRVVLGCGCAVVAAGGAAAAFAMQGGTSPEAPLPPGPKRFVIGVYTQPTYTFDDWKRRGINTLVVAERLSGTVPWKTWHAEARSHGFAAIRAPHGSPAKDARDPLLTAWLLPDEPDLEGTGMPPAEVNALAARWRKAAPGVPIVVNLSGGNVHDRKHELSQYERWTAGADWVSNDYYPVTGWDQPGWIERGETSTPVIGAVLDTLHGVAKKPQLQIIESSDQNLDWVPQARGVTPDELRGQIWHSIIHGARGIVYFPLQFKPEFKFDATPPDVAAEMTRQNRRLKRLGPVLLSAGRRVDVPAPFESATRRRGGKTYTFTLNLSHSQASLKGRKFGPYELKIDTTR